MNEAAVYRINEPDISSEEIDGEVIIVNLLNGNYYSAQDMGAFIWGRISHGDSLGTIHTALTGQFGDSEPAMRDDLSAFIDKLEEEELIVNAEGSDATSDTRINAPAPEQYTAPDFSCYSDMNDLLLLDPVHDVADEGWPKKKQAWPTANTENNE